MTRPNFFPQKDAQRMPYKLCQVWRRCAPLFFWPPQKNLTGVASPPPPVPARVKGSVSSRDDFCFGMHLTLPGTGGGVDATPPKVFLRWPKTGGAQRRQTWHSLRGILCASFGGKIWSGHVRSRSYDVISGTISDRFFGKSLRLC